MGMNQTPSTAHSTQPVVVVCGSTNVDTFASVTDFPAPGETVIGQRGIQSLGGKGANQAAASAHLGNPRGVRTVFLSAVGRAEEDPLSELAMGELEVHGVDVRHVARVAEPTGQAFIMNDATGENIIVVMSGANETVNPLDYVGLLRGSGAGAVNSASREDPGAGECAGSGEQERLGDVKVLLAQGELTPEHSALLPELAAAVPGARFVLNLAPVTTRDEKLIAAADPLMVNEIEAADVLGLPRDTPQEELFAQLGAVAKSAVVTLGSQGAAIIVPGEEVQIVASPPSPEVVDTTGAGDAFAGTFAAALAAGETMVRAAQLGACAGSLATRKNGAAASYATEAEIAALAEEFFN